MISAIIIDDERLARVELKKLLQEHPGIEVIGEAANAIEGRKKIEQLCPDLLFLDVQMPGKSGFDMLAETEWVPVVIFTTAYDEYALKAFEVNALDYLLKPIESKRLADALQKLRLRFAEEGGPGLPKGELRPLLRESDQVFVKDGERCWFVRLAEIRLFESVGNYARVYFGPHKPLILKSLNALEERLDERLFFRANRKHIVNLSMIEKIDPHHNGGLLLDLRNGEQIEVSRRQTVRFREMMSL